MSKERIDLELPLPTVSLKRFILRAVRDDEFFEFALESPLKAMSEAGVELDIEEIAPSDFAGFFGALGRLREMLGEDERRSFRFEDVFGRDAHIEGAILAREVERGICRDWDRREALMKQSRFRAFTTNFERSAELDRLADLELLRPKSIFHQRFSEMRLELDVGGIKATSESSEKFRGYDKEWDSADAVQNRRATQNVSSSFEDARTMLGLDLLRGPLMRASDLVNVATRLDVLIDLRERGLGQ
ncbi:MAG: hypothetical protein ACOCZ7_00515 [Armatimonadota bacterium]